MKNRDRLLTIYENTKGLGIVNSQYGFSRLCGRRQSWFSASISVGRPFSLSAMITLATALENLSKTDIEREQCDKARQLINSLWLIIKARAMSPTGSHDAIARV